VGVKSFRDTVVFGENEKETWNGKKKATKRSVEVE